MDCKQNDISDLGIFVNINCCNKQKNMRLHLNSIQPANQSIWYRGVKTYFNAISLGKQNLLLVEISRTKYYESTIIQKNVMGLANWISFDILNCNMEYVKIRVKQRLSGSLGKMQSILFRIRLFTLDSSKITESFSELLHMWIFLTWMTL